MQAHFSHRKRSNHCKLKKGFGCNAPARLPVHVSRYTTCHSTASAAAAAAAAKQHLMRPVTPRWFGFDTETCGDEVLNHEVIALAAYELETGEAYTALINPALHDPSYSFGGDEVHGLSRAVLEQQGVSCQQAFDGLVSFVNSRTPPGHTPALVAHNGFAFHFPIMEAALLRSAHATMPLQSAAGSSSSSSSCGGSSSSEAISGSVCTGWPGAWLFHDTLLLAHCVEHMQPYGAPLRARLIKRERGAMAKALLPGYSEAGVTPQERAFVGAASAARLSAVLLGLLEVEVPPELLPEAGFGLGTNIGPLLQHRHAPWLSRPWPLDTADAAALPSHSADAAQLADGIQKQLSERFPGLGISPWHADRRMGLCGLEHCPRAMQAAAAATMEVAVQSHGQMAYDAIAGYGF